MDGYFEMDCDRGGDQLLFSYVGFKQQEMRATPGANLLVTLEEDSQALEEVVVVGYGMRSRSSLTGSVAGLMVGSSSAAATAPLEKLEEQDQKAKEEADNEQLYNELMQLN